MLNVKFLKNKYALLFFIYVVVLILFTACSYKLRFHDTLEYITMAKKFAGFLNADVFIVHSLVYPFFLSFFARYLPSMLTMKLVNISWLILIGLLLYKFDLKKSSFIIWVFSPIAWMMSPMISPVLPASFFLLVSYLSIKKWQESNKNSHLIISALALGLTAAFYDFAGVIALIFLLVFFYEKKFKKVVLYSLFTLLAFSVRLVLDASLFSLVVRDKLFPLPFYTLIRFWGAMLVIELGLHPVIPVIKLFITRFDFWGFLILISPLLFCLYRLDYKKNKEAIIFLVISAIIFLFQGGAYYYFILLAPIIVILLGEVLQKKELILHVVISSFIIFVMVYPYFIPDKQEIEKRNLVIKDLEMINKDFDFDTAMVHTETLAIFYMWDKNLPYFISDEEYNRIVQNNDYYSQYVFEVKSKIDTNKILELKAGLKTNIKENVDYQTLPQLLEKGENPPEGYKLTKCYDMLCVYQKIS